MSRISQFCYILLLTHSQSVYAGNVQRTIVETETLESNKWTEILDDQNYQNLKIFPESASLQIETCDFLNRESCDYFIIRKGRICQNTIAVTESCQKGKCEYQFNKTEPEQCLE